MPHRIIFFKLEPFAREYLAKSGALAKLGVEVAFNDAILNKDNIPVDKNFDIAGIFVDSVMDKVALDKLPNLKFIATLSTGYDHIDLAECKKRGIAVSYVPSYGENTVAEFTFGLILELSRKISVSSCEVRETGKFGFGGERGFDLKGRTLGLVGTGRIGKHVAKIAKGFEMNILAYDVIKDEAAAKAIGFRYVALEELLKNSDIVTLHVPYMKETHHLINVRNIKLLKKGTYLINTSRGGVVETGALLEALESGNIAGAGLDVLESEELLRGGEKALAAANKEELEITRENQALMKMPNVVVTPHNAFNTGEAFIRILGTTIENISAYVGGKPINLVP